MEEDLNPIPFYPSRLKDLKLDELKTAFEHIGKSKIPKKPLKKHYLSALRKDVKKMISDMATDTKKEWLDNAGIEHDECKEEHLGPLILQRVM